MKKLACTLLIVAILFSSGLLFVGDVHADTNVNGTIAPNTIWTLAKSPYTLTGQVTVPTGVTLTIEPGVTVNLGTYYIRVSGTLNASGTSDNNIVFGSNATSYNNQRIEFSYGSTAWNEQTGTGCIIENIVFANVTLTINGSPKINSTSFSSALSVPSLISVTGGAPQIFNDTLNCQNTGINVAGGSPVISYNTIAGNGHSTGIYTSGTAVIQNNLIINNNYGINLYGSSVVEYNVVAGNTFGISGFTGNIQFNTVTQNSIGLQVSGGSGTLKNNNIFNNNQANLLPFTSTSLDATNNWWGTTDSVAISQMILDSKTYNYVGAIIFNPFLTQLDPSVPPLPNIYLNYPQNVDLGPKKTPSPPPSTPLPPTPTQAPTPTSVPTPCPTPKNMPGSPLSMGDVSFDEALSRFDITSIAELVLLILGIIWVAVILVSVDRNFDKKTSEKQ